MEAVTPEALLFLICKANWIFSGHSEALLDKSPLGLTHFLKILGGLQEKSWYMPGYPQVPIWGLVIDKLGMTAKGHKKEITLSFWLATVGNGMLDQINFTLIQLGSSNILVPIQIACRCDDPLQGKRRRLVNILLVGWGQIKWHKIFCSSRDVQNRGP